MIVAWPVQGLTASAGWPTICRHPLFFVPRVVPRIRHIVNPAIDK